MNTQRPMLPYGAGILGAMVLLFAAGCTPTRTDAEADMHTEATRVARAPASDDPARLLEPFPPAAPEQVRWVITLPARAHEHQIKVELLPSIRIMADCNHYLVPAEVQSHTVPGWGYPYQVMGDIGPVATTMMGCSEGSSQERDMPVQADLVLQRYNSHMPIVFYTPAQVTLHYRLWHGENTVQSAVPSD